MARLFWAESNWPDEVLHNFGLEGMEWIKVNACCNVLAEGRSYSWAHFFLFGIYGSAGIN